MKNIISVRGVILIFYLVQFSMKGVVISLKGYEIESLFQDCIKEWWSLCREKSVPVSDNFSLSATLGDPLSTRAWQIAGLPVDK